ncbi:type I DNA topoisomerase [Agarivorans gilvus]|uniref:DNA topoisomerase 1 n=1 Tax=Agarivorans gilvus TaxID=680279 RepID=A0ABQ1HV25_9ALTE|nr:type I DNA topoisomerase [Agarivorans gilvus]GGA92932.1 DNA topoisomerase 1 [Agarivorans gilvus]
MSKSLVIVESPAKAKTINKYLGRQYVVKSSVGHIRDLPSSGSSTTKKKAAPVSTKGLSAEEKAKLKKAKDQKALVARMGVDPEKDWKANYQILPGKEKVVNELKSLAESADTIYLATDLDREGEAIAWHLKEVIGGDDSRFKRVVFNEITKTAIKDAFSHPSELNMDRVNAQQARRFLDRVVGYMVSPLLWKKIARGLSAGRVQSVAVRLVVEKEREIKAFVPEEFWDIHADLATSQGEALRLEVAKQQGQAFKPVNKEQAEQAVASLQAAKYQVSKREDKPTRSKPKAPYITSTMQQAASTRLGFGVKRTMMLAQRLYEAGYITYMRTDSTNLSKDAVEAVRGYIDDNFGAKYLPENPLRYSSKEGAQEAHEAIRPSDVTVTSAQLAGVDNDAAKLYDLIWRQFVACQMTDAQYDATTVTVTAGDFELRAKGKILRFDGWTRVQPVGKANKGEDGVLPAVAQGDSLDLVALDPKQHFTKPPARFNEASLVRELEKRGIGRPSTYASIISTIQDRGYVRTEGRRFYAEKMGEIVSERLCESFQDLMNYDFTAEMEERLDEVADGNFEWKQVLNQFYKNFKKQLTTADDDEKGMRSNTPVITNIECPDCQRPMGIRTASTGVFLGCSGYALPPKERCKCTINLIPGEEAVAADAEEQETEALRAKERCPVCGTAMDSYLIDEKRKLHVCGNNPDCEGYIVEQGNFKIKGYDGPIVECEKCGSDMQLRTGRFGKYMACTGEDCSNTRKILKNGEVAPPREDPVHLPELPCVNSDAYFVLRDGASGIFMAASNFPRSRETRAPLVEELQRFKDRLPEKFYYLAEGPVADPDGVKTLIRYSRKTKEQYISSEVDGKPTGWRAYFSDGKWVAEDKRKKPKKKA